MCGIFGVLSDEPVVNKIIKGLHKLEYRGYDSSGVSVVVDQKIQTIRAQGKLINLKKKLSNKKIEGTLGIGHTRWATHGIPSTKNAHPHNSTNVSIVHNGIIENYSELKKDLLKKGYVFKSETDSEVIAHLIDLNLKNSAPEQALKKTLSCLEGAFAIAMLFKDQNFLVGARKGSPLAIGISEKSFYLGSDSIALSPFTQKIIYMEEGDSVFIFKDKFNIFDSKFKKVIRKVSKSSFSDSKLGKGNFDHFMQKEIFEQPNIISNSLSRFLDPINKKINIPELKIKWNKIKRIDLIACGTSFFASQIATYWFENYIGIPSSAHLASEYRYKRAQKSSSSLSIFISQSGETADTLAALRHSKKNKNIILSLVNNRESSIARESDFYLTIEAGPEIGVASTKAFTAQLSILSCLCLVIGRELGAINHTTEKKLTESLIEIPSNMSSILEFREEIKKLSKNIYKAKSVLYLGRGHCYPLAMEGALKLKEISYIHAEGYASGEMKHGPIALVDEKLPIVFIAPKNYLFEKNISNMKEVLARGGKVLLITDKLGINVIDDKNIQTLVLPNVSEFVQPILFSLPIQLLAYYAAVFKKTDVDQPRNLAKSVTVE